MDNDDIYSLIHHTNQPVQWILSIKTHGFLHMRWKGTVLPWNDFWVPVQPCGEDIYVYIYIYLYINTLQWELWLHMITILFMNYCIFFFLLALLCMPFSFGISILIDLITIWFLVMAPNLGCSLQFGTRVFALVTNCSLTFSPVFFIFF